MNKHLPRVTIGLQKLFMEIAGIDILCLKKKFLVYNLVSRNLKIKYRRSILGFLWTILVPLAMALVYYFVFSVILAVKTEHYLIVILSGVMPWAFFSQTVLEGMDSVVGNAGLMTKVPIPAQVFPFVGVVTNMISLGLSIPILLGAAIATGGPIGYPLIMEFYFLAILGVQAYGLAVLFSHLFVYLRDLRHIFSVVMQLWFYATPVIYKADMIPEKFRFILYLNPVGYLFSGLQSIWVLGVWPSPPEILVPLVWAGAIWVVTVIAMKKMSKSLVEYL